MKKKRLLNPNRGGNGAPVYEAGLEHPYNDLGKTVPADSVCGFNSFNMYTHRVQVPPQDGPGPLGIDSHITCTCRSPRRTCIGHRATIYLGTTLHTLTPFQPPQCTLLQRTTWTPFQALGCDERKKGLKPRFGLSRSYNIVYYHLFQKKQFINKNM